MTTTWDRLERLLSTRHPRRGWAWLAEQLGVSVQRVQNWKTRGVPAAAVPDIAIKLSVSTDYLFGLSDAVASPDAVREGPASYGWPFKGVTLEQFLHLTEADRANIEGYLTATVHSALRHTRHLP